MITIINRNSIQPAVSASVKTPTMTKIRTPITTVAKGFTFRTAVVAAVSMAGMLPLSSQAQTLCIWDILGTAGDGYALMRDYALGMQRHVSLDLKAFPDEAEAVRNYQAGNCDALVATSFTTRQFNPLTGSLNAIGATPNPSVVSDAINLLLSPKLAKEMVVGNNEVAGIVPQGAAYLLVRDRSNNSLEKVHGLKFAAIDIDKAQQYMIHKVGAQPVVVSLNNFAHEFNSGTVDVAGSPAMAIQPLELYQGMGDKGGIIRFPVSYVTMDVVIHADKFPEGYGTVSRAWFSSQLKRMMRNVDRMEKSIKPEYWVDISKEDKASYSKLMGEMRKDLTDDGVYSAKMIRILDRVRCYGDPQSVGCTK